MTDDTSENTPADTPPDTRTPQTAPSPKQHARRGPSRRREQRSLARRFKALGLDKPAGNDLDELRRRLVLKLALVVNRWRGCPEAICRRNRGCMAPQGDCTNIPPLSPEEEERRKADMLPRLQKELKARLAAIEGPTTRAGHGLSDNRIAAANRRAALCSPDRPCTATPEPHP